MKNSQKGFIAPLLIALVAILVVGGTSVYYFKNHKSTPEPISIIDDKEATLAGISSVIDANNQFALDLYSKLKKDEGNIFFSPYSISTAIAMVYEGAKGKTADEIQAVFHFPTEVSVRRPAFLAIYNELNKTDSKYKLSVANALWAQKDYKFLDDYFTTIEKYYGGKATNVDFKNSTEDARQIINNWVESKTNNKIKDLFPKGSLDSSNKLVLTNAIYFKGTWNKQFKKDQTKDGDFRVNTSNSVKVPMMKQTGEDAKFLYAEDNTLQALEMPYKGDKLSIIILLPKNDNISSFENTLTLEKINEWKAKLTEKRVDIFIPKFTFNTKYFMSDTLSKMGMSTAFTDSADFSGMDGTQNLSIQTVVHQAFVDVNEEGTEAAAATGIGIAGTALPEAVPVFRADHPFIFIIQAKDSGNILFLGRVSNPKK